MTRQLLDRTNLVEDGLDGVIKDHALVGCLRKDAIKAVGLVAQRGSAHGQLNDLSLDTIRGDHDGAILLDLAPIAPSTPNNYIDVCVSDAGIRGLKVALLTLGAPGGGRGYRVGGRDGAGAVETRCCVSDGGLADGGLPQAGAAVGSRAHAGAHDGPVQLPVGACRALKRHGDGYFAHRTRLEQSEAGAVVLCVVRSAEQSKDGRIAKQNWRVNRKGMENSCDAMG